MRDGNSGADDGTRGRKGGHVRVGVEPHCGVCEGALHASQRVLEGSIQAHGYERCVFRMVTLVTIEMCVTCMDRVVQV